MTDVNIEKEHKETCSRSYNLELLRFSLVFYFANLYESVFMYCFFVGTICNYQFIDFEGLQYIKLHIIFADTVLHACAVINQSIHPKIYQLKKLSSSLD